MEGLELDGNAAAGAFGDVFGLELSGARGACGACGGIELVGGQPAYLQAPGAVLRCRHCHNVLGVLVYGKGRYWLSLQGFRWLELYEPPS